jgi:GNAT superfamily N-acetyltransferase
MPNAAVVLRTATETDVPAILALIEGLADYERLRDACVATEAKLRATLFGATPKAEVIIADHGDRGVAGFALFCTNYSTFLAQPGIWLEDLFVKPEFRGERIGKLLLTHLAQLAVERDCGRVEWAVLNWNTPSIGFYESLGARGLDEWTTYRLTGDAMTALAAGGA